MSAPHVSFGIVLPRYVKLRIRRRDQPVVFNIRGYSDNRPPWPLRAEREKSQLFSNGLFLRKHFVRQRFTQNYRILGRRSILVHKSAPAQDANPQRRKIIRRHHAPAHHSASSLRGTLPSWDVDGGVERGLHATRRWQCVAQRQIRHSRNSFEPCFHISKEGDLLRCIGITVVGQGNLRGDDLLSREAQRNALNLPETPQQQSRSREENHRAGNLSRNQSMSQKPTSRRAHGPSAEGFGRRIRECRHHTKKNAGKQRNSESESEHAKIQRCLTQAHNSLGRNGDESLEQQVRKAAPRNAPQQREQQALRQCLPRQACPACAKRRAHRKLALSAHRPCKHQIRHICTGKHQDRDDCAKQNPRANARIFDLAVAQRTNSQRHFCAKLRRYKSQRVLKPRLEPCSRLLDRNAWFQARECPQHHARIFPVERRVVQRLRQQHVRSPQVWHLEFCGKDSDNLDRLPVERKSLSCNARVTRKSRVPQPVREEGDARRVGSIVFPNKIAANNRTDAERRKKRRFHQSTTQPYRILLSNVAVRSSWRYRRHGLKGCALRTQKRIFRSQHELDSFKGRFDAKGNQAVIVRIRQAAEQHAVHYAENGGGRPNA